MSFMKRVGRGLTHKDDKIGGFRCATAKDFVTYFADRYRKKSSRACFIQVLEV